MARLPRAGPRPSLPAEALIYCALSPRYPSEFDMSLSFYDCSVAAFRLGA